ncbi:hypothetical protein Dimus_017624 [Dionaea muscipula]
MDFKWTSLGDWACALRRLLFPPPPVLRPPLQTADIFPTPSKTIRIHRLWTRKLAAAAMMLVSSALSPGLITSHKPLSSISTFFNSSAPAKQRHRYRPLKPLAMAKDTSDDTGNGLLEKLATASGLVAVPVIGWSLYTLKTTGCGLPPGPGGSIGALEGVSYLVVVGIVGWSAYTKAKTGSGLPNGPFGLLGAVEGISYLALLAVVVVFGLQLVENGSIPGPVPVPGGQCFG